MNNSATWESETLDKTSARSGAWKVTVTWRRVRTTRDNGHIYAAAVEMRGWKRGDGLDDETADRAITTTARRPPVLSSYVLTRLRWGQLLDQHRDLLSKQLEAKSKTARRVATGSPVKPIAVRLADDLDELASDATTAPTGRANAGTYQLVVEFYRLAEKENPNAKALAVLEDLQQAGYDLDPANTSDRVKVRRWISEARKKDSLPPVTNERKEDR